MLKRRPKEVPEVPTDSFSDLAFLLIIFFILATSLTKLQGMKTELPSSEKGAEHAAEKNNTIQMNDNGFTFNGDRVDLKNLDEKLKQLKLHEKKGEEKIVMLETTGKVNYQDYYSVLTSISAAGGVVAIVSEDGGQRAKP